MAPPVRDSEARSSHQQVLKTFEELSSLLDQRLYRMRLIFWAAKRRAREPLKPASIDAELTDYRARSLGSGTTTSTETSR